MLMVRDSESRRIRALGTCASFQRASLLRDGKWGNFKELAEKNALSEERLCAIEYRGWVLLNWEGCHASAFVKAFLYVGG